MRNQARFPILSTHNRTCKPSQQLLSIFTMAAEVYISCTSRIQYRTD